LPRPPIAVVVPFLGTPIAAEELLVALARLPLGGDDEIAVVDNGGRDAFARLEADAVQVVCDAAERSSYYARNRGAEATAAPWLLFMDADCRPQPDLLDRYFDPPPQERAGIVAGAVRGAAEQRSLAARYARSRGHLDEAFHLRSRPYAAGITANLLVRREPFERVGGFHEGVRSGADVELCWRLQEIGWEIEHRPAAAVEHLHPDSLRSVLARSIRYGAGRRWVNRRYRGSMPRPRLAAPLARAAAGGVGWPLLGQPRRGLYKLIDGAVVAADAWGYVAGDSRAARGRAAAGGAGPRVALVTDAFPARSETFVYNEALALRDLGHDLRVEAHARPAAIERAPARALPTAYVEDYSAPEALRDLAWLGARHPIGCLRDLRSRRRWRAEEPVFPLRAIASAVRRMAAAKHVHVHFAAGAALTAMRAALLVGVPYSVVGHGYDVFQRPANLAEKLRRARLVIAPCEYTAGHLRALMPPGGRERVQVVIAGVDTDTFRRRTPHPGDATAIAIGRLVEKKGFLHLIEATAELRERRAIERLVIVGEGPLRAKLAGAIERLGLEDVAELVAAWGADEIRERLEGADVLVAPSVIASDGDRDAMPVAVKEALATEVPVVTSDVAGLPELVRAEWGRMVAPADPHALAAAIGEVLALPVDQRRRMGAAGREFVVERCELRREAARLASLISATGRG